RLARTVAMKCLRAALSDDLDARRRLEREARSASQLEHPGIVPVYDFFEHEGEWYLVYAFVEGETVAARLERDGFAVGEALGVAAEVLDALAHAHARGVVHRDISSRNV